MKPSFQIGQTVRYQKTIQDEDVRLFAQVTGDTNPLHLDETYAQKTRFRGRIAHGILTLGLISAVLGTRLPGPGAIYLEQQVRFLHPVRIGDTITAEVTVLAWHPEKRRLRVQTRCYNQDDIMVLDGEALLLIDEIPE